LLSDAARTVQEQARRKRSTRDGIYETLAQALMAVELDEGHDP
jgi:hypothetical protein